MLPVVSVEDEYGSHDAESHGSHEKSSHCGFVYHPGETLSFAAYRPIKPIYVKLFLDLIEGN
jgi:hypothetical protein